MVTSAPAPARRSAMARPMRLAPPVTRADLPDSGTSDIMPRGSGVRRRSRLVVRLAVRLGFLLGLVAVLFVLRVVFVDRVLLARALHAHLDRHLVFLDRVVATIRLETLGDNLQTNRL